MKVSNRIAKYIPKIFLVEKENEPEANRITYSPYSNILYDGLAFDGEKTPYELGEPIDIYPEYYSLRIRAWASFISDASVQNAIKKYCLWLVGAGLKLQSEPVIKVLQKKGLEVNKDILKEFIEDSESQFRLFTELNESVYSNQHNLHEEAAETLKNALLAGDMLCLLRFDGKYPSIETIDGRHIETPDISPYIEEAERRGNLIKDGVEIDKKGSHIAYYVRQEDLTFSRIERKNKSTSQLQAWLIYGLKAKKSDVRGMSLLTAVMETVKKLDRYKEATVGGAEENAKIPLTIEHNQFSDGENPFIKQMQQAAGKSKGVAPETQNYLDCNPIATKVAQTTGKATYNLPLGAKFNRHTGSSDIHFGEFFGVNIDIIYATLGIPPEVAMDKFGGAYSGSRAALKSWEYKMKVDRIKLLKWQFYKPFYDFWLNINTLQNNIQAPGYLRALSLNDIMILGAYRNCRFIGAGVPHIDPVKEASAARIKLGDKLKGVPLISIAETMEDLNSNDFEQTINKVNDEKESVKDFIDNDNNNNNTTSE